MTCPKTIRYERLPSSCRAEDEKCSQEMAAGSLMLALDYATNTTTAFYPDKPMSHPGLDGNVTVDQIKYLLNNRGKFDIEKFKAVAKTFNDDMKSRGFQLSAVPYALDFQMFLRNKHRCVYEELFGPTEKKLSVNEIKKSICGNLLELANILEKASRGDSQDIDQRNFVVNVYANGFGLKREFHQIFIDAIGGPENAETAQDLLIAAFSKLQTAKSDGESCDKPLPDGSVDISGCYKKTAKNLRALARLL